MSVAVQDLPSLFHKSLDDPSAFGCLLDVLMDSFTDLDALCDGDRQIVMTLLVNAETYARARVAYDCEVNAIQQDMLQQLGAADVCTPSPVEEGNEDQHSSALRLWYKDHLDHPFPTFAERSLLAKQAGVTPDQLQQYFTNLRRRSQYNAVLKAHFGGGKEAMSTYIKRVMIGELDDENEERRTAVQGYIRYICGSEDEKKVGAWLKEVIPVSDEVVDDGASTINRAPSGSKFAELHAAGLVPLDEVKTPRKRKLPAGRLRHASRTCSESSNTSVSSIDSHLASPFSTASSPPDTAMIPFQSPHASYAFTFSCPTQIPIVPPGYTLVAVPSHTVAQPPLWQYGASRSPGDGKRKCSEVEGEGDWPAQKMPRFTDVSD